MMISCLLFESVEKIDSQQYSPVDCIIIEHFPLKNTTAVVSYVL